MQSKIMTRIEAETGLPGLYSVLAERLSPSDLQSLLMSVYRARARTIREADLLSRTEHAALFLPSSVDARLLNGFDCAAFASADAFEAVDLSPVCPLGPIHILCLRISPATHDGLRYPVTDGGFTDWTARLLQDKKERFLTTGIGSEFVCRRYGPVP
jgi:hypothetical protein